jgi:hypothetical protein
MTAKTVAEKLLIKPNTTIWLSHNDHLPRLSPLPDGVRQVDPMETASVALIFAEDAASLREILIAHKDQLARPATLWVVYPKANRTDINRDTLWPILSEYGLRPITQVAVDDTWSALRFRPMREGEAPFAGGR